MPAKRAYTHITTGWYHLLPAANQPFQIQQGVHIFAIADICSACG